MRVVVLCLAMLGCAAGPPAPAAGARLALGHRTDDGGFTRYSDGEEVTLVAGAQGGFHVWLSYQMTPALSGEAALERTAHRTVDDALVLRTMGQVELDGAPSEPLPMFMCPSPVGLSVLDQPISYELRFLDERDDQRELARGAITLVPHCPPEELEFCQRICNG